MSYNLSGCVFIRNTFKGAFCLFESMYQILPFCDEMIVMDLGSDDGTLEVLNEIAARNPKIEIVHSKFYENDAAIFAKLANDLVKMASHPHVFYFQSDEIWHENLIGLTKQALDEGRRDLTFWRVQLRYNFQQMKWYPHPVHRVAPKDNFVFTQDGMNSNRVFDVPVVGNWDLSHYRLWDPDYSSHPVDMPFDEMVLDVSLTGAFLDNIPDRRRMHLPFWHEGEVMPGDEGGLPIDTWHNQQRMNQDWYRRDTPFNIPQIMRYHLGKRRYELRPELLEALKLGVSIDEAKGWWR